jgi:L-ascorbate 6-phosphate lactonase
MVVLREPLFRTPPRGHVALHYLGQGGFVVVSDQGTRVAIDPYLSDSVPLTRVTPIPVRPEDLEVAHVLLTHDHSDHTDPDTCIPLLRSRSVSFWGPASTLRVLRAAGAPPDRLREIERGGHVDIHDIHVEAVHAEHTEDSVGYVLAASKHNVYHTGDTVESPQLYWLHDRGIEVLITGFAGRWEAMEANQAAGLAEALGARVVIPMHYETFAENTADPARLVQAVQQRPTCRAWVRVLSLNERFLYPPTD